MRLFNDNSRLRGQTSIEYLLLLAVVAVVVIASFSRGSLIDQLHDSAAGYYGTVTQVIMDSDGTNPNHQDIDNPKPVDGQWCPLTCPPPGSSGFKVMYRACECPPPMFGGRDCNDPANPYRKVCGKDQKCKGPQVTCTNGVSSCSCPDGRPCDSDGNCTVCSLDCSSVPNSSPDITCTQCLCNSGTLISTGGCSLCPPCYTSNDGKTCVPVVCGANQYCDTSQPASTECACDAYTYFDTTASSCTFCQAIPPTPSAPAKCTRPNSTATSCSAYDCSTDAQGHPTNQNCNATTNQCQCNTGYSWDGTKCVYGNVPCVPEVPCGDSNCGKDSCGIICGNGSGQCGSGQSCVVPSPGLPGDPGTCQCSSSCDGYECGTDGCGDPCGQCTTGQTCDATTWPGHCDACVPTTCTANTCAGTAGTDNCGGTCTASAPLSCQTLQECNPSTGACCTPTTACPNDPNACGTDSCTVPCGSDGGKCPTGGCSAQTGPGTCGCVPDGTCTVPAAICGSSLGTDNCGDVCIGSANVCGPGKTCDAEGQCVCGTCSASYACGSTAGIDDCGNPCIAVQGSCAVGQECSSSFQCVCQPSGICLPSYACGSTAGLDSNCPEIPCNVDPAPACSNGYDCNGSDQCICKDSGICLPSYACGSTAGTDSNCPEDPCNVPTTPVCPNGYSCNSSDQCTCKDSGVCVASYACGSTAGVDSACSQDPCNLSVAPQCTSDQACINNKCVGCTAPINGACSAWGSCSVTACGTVGTQTCLISTAAQCGGQPAPASQPCDGDVCSNPNQTCSTILKQCVNCTAPVNGQCTSWSACTATACGQAGTQTCLSSTQPSCGGAAAPTTQACSGDAPQDGQCTSWSPCSATACGAAGTQNCLVSTPPACGGQDAPTAQACKGSTPVDGACNAWGSCSTACGSGTQNCTSVVPAQCGGNPAPTTQACTGTTPVDGSCSTWSDCSVSCGAGTETCISPVPAQCGGQAAPISKTCTGTQCQVTFTASIIDYADCSSCAGVCANFGLAGHCGQQNCGGNPASCPVNNNGGCVSDASGVGWNCGSGTGACVSQVDSTNPCPDGIEAIINQQVSNQTQGDCTVNPPHPGSATVTYTVICKP